MLTRLRSMAPSTMQALDPSRKLVTSSLPVELYQVKGSQRTKLKDGAPLEVYTSAPNKHYPLLSAVLSVGDVQWQLTQGTHTMRSTSDAGEPTFIFSSVVDRDPDTFFCVILKRGHPAHEIEVLEQVLGKLSVMHMSKNVKKNQVPFNLPQIDPSIINEIMRKGAEDTQMLLQKAGEAANNAFHTAAEMHKKYAPKPAEKPVEVNPEVKDKIAKTKQAAAAGAAVAKGVATGMQAATVEVGTSLVQTVTAAGGKDSKNAGDQAKKGPVPEPVKMVGGIGMELLRDIAAVRDAMLDAAGNAWSGMREATVDVMQYQYGNEVAAVAADSADVVEGVANMGVAMKYAQPTQVVLTSAKETSKRMETTEKAAAAGAASKEEEARLRKQLEDERAALERERAALAAERAKMQQNVQQQQRHEQAQQQQQQQRKGGWPFGFAPA